MTNLGHETLRSMHLYIRSKIRSRFQHYNGKQQGPEGIFNTTFWEEVLEESFSYNEENWVFITVIDESGNVLASVGDTARDISTIPVGLTSLDGDSIFVMEAPFFPRRSPPPRKKALDRVRDEKTRIEESFPKMRGPGRPRMHHFKGKYRIGIRPSSADFIMHQARTQILTSSLAILALVFLAFYLLRTLGRFIKLQEREKSERHLTTMGRMGATLAHEIRNPLGAIKGLTQVVQEKLSPDDESQQSLTTIVSEAERLEHLVTDLLSYAKPKTVNIERINLNTLFEEIANVIQHKAQEAKVPVTFHHNESRASIHSDKDGLRQVLLNVIVNAIEATPIGKKIQVNTKINDRKELVVEVVDEGQGLGNKTSEELFEPFMTTKLKGTGLGLSISRKIVDTLSGTIHLMNNQNVGAKCIIKVPTTE